MPRHPIKRQYFVYIMSNRTRTTLYVGMTNELSRRVFEHKHGLIPGFTSRYNITKLLHYEAYDYVTDAIAREKEIKKWRREKKDRLIDENNPERSDLSRLVLEV